MQGILAYIQSCEESWRRAASGALSKEQTEWLSWARSAAEKIGPKGYPDPSRDGNFDAKAVPVGGPYPENQKIGSATNPRNQNHQKSNRRRMSHHHRSHFRIG